MRRGRAGGWSAGVAGEAGEAGEAGAAGVKGSGVTLGIVPRVVHVHDDLARAVLAEERQDNRWSMALREGETRYAARSYDTITRLIAQATCGT